MICNRYTSLRINARNKFMIAKFTNQKNNFNVLRIGYLLCQSLKILYENINNTHIKTSMEELIFSENNLELDILVTITEPFSVGIYLLKVNNRNTRTRCEICSKLTIKTPERR